MSAPRRAVIGSGVAGLTAAHVLSTRGPVTLYEADARLGGHADTHEVEVDGRTVGVDQDGCGQVVLLAVARRSGGVTLADDDGREAALERELGRTAQRLRRQA